jgi:hypothetical protein
MDLNNRRKGFRLHLFFVRSKLTADCIVDLIEQWWEQVKDQCELFPTHSIHAPHDHICPPVSLETPVKEG